MPPDGTPRHPLRRRRYWLAFYLLLLLASHIAREFQAQSFDHPDIVYHQLDDEVVLAHHHLKPKVLTLEYPILLLHGSPMASPAMLPLGHKLAEQAEVLVPDLPGFGYSTHDIPNYGIKAHADYLEKWLEQLPYEKVHIIAYSQGGGPAIHLAAEQPERIASLTLMASIGVQELELLGDYFLNHGLYALQLGGLWIIQEGFPHFGLMDSALLNVSYARNFYDTDQRPLRDLMKGIKHPTLIIHSESDRLVPIAAAKEAQRIIPQSEFLLTPSGHMIPFNLDSQWLAPLFEFIQGSEERNPKVSAKRIAAASIPFDPSAVLKPAGGTLIAIMILLALSTWISEDLTCVGAGLMVANGNLELFPAALACLVGIFSGDFLLYLSGKHIGRPALKYPPLKWMVKPHQLERSAQWFDQKGPAAIIMSRFTPGLRLPTYVAAGIAGMRWSSFCIYFLIAAILWTPTIVFLSSLLGSQMLDYLEHYQHYALFIFLGFVALYITAKKLLLPLCSYRGRRMLLSAWRRKTRWEFWPMWQFYPPVIVYIAWLAIKHRGLACTACNPAMPASGVIGESKIHILNGIHSPHVAEFIVIHKGEVQKAEQFMINGKLNYPIVLKPDLGQRGEGVHIIKDHGQLVAALSGISGRWMLQAFAPGHEFGVFYYRYPNEEKGHIFAITDKRFTEVKGDGQSTLEELILNDDRAVCQAALHLQNHASSLSAIPKLDETIPLVELGTHCRGSLFLDGADYISPALIEKIDQISKSYEGFYFGRYDIRVSDLEAFKRGEQFKILELNGVTSEATNIYDPQHSLRFAYRTLRTQWRLAFEIGELNRKNGHATTGVVKLYEMWLNFPRQS